MREDVKNLIYLSACAIQGITPDTNRVLNIDHGALWALASSHNMTSVVASALASSAPFKEKTVSEAVIQKWSRSYYMALTNELKFDAERKVILDFMEENGIWYAPLKGIIIKTLYPKRGMREMSDNDILFDDNYADMMREFMENRGYETETFNLYHHDAYLKEPIYNFELHRTLFAEKDEPLWFEYYKNLKSKLIKDDDNKFGYHFSYEDLYIHTIAHAKRHYTEGGTGFKTFMDNYVFLEAKGDTLDKDYINRELIKLDIADYEKKLADMSYRLFANPERIFEDEFNPEDEHWLYDTEISGTYGSIKTSAFRKMNEISEDQEGMSQSTKRKYIMGRLFPKPEHIRKSYPLSDKVPILIPYFYIHRIVRNVVLRKNAIDAEIASANQILEHDKQKSKKAR